MSFDVATLLLAIWVASLSMGAAVFIVAWGHPDRDGLGHWGAGLLLMALAFVLFSLLGFLPGRWSFLVAVGNVFLSGSYALGLLAVGRFLRQPVPRWHVWGPVLLVGLVSLVWLEKPLVRVLWCDAVLLVQWLLLIQLAMHGGGRPLERGRWLLVSGGALGAAIYMQRMAAIVLGHESLVLLHGSDPVQVLSTLLGMTGQVFATLGFVLMAHERTQAEHRKQALLDTLTGVPNRRALMQALDRVLAQAVREQRPVALLMVDIDRFKSVNDTYGHQAGDAVLAAVARCLRDGLRAQDFLGRYGGEEFLVLLPATDSAGAARLAEHLRQGVQQMELPWEQQMLGVTISIGVHAQVPTNSAGASAMIEAADQAMYAAKRAGRNRVEIQDAAVAAPLAGSAAA